MDGLKPFQEDRPKSKGEADQDDADLAIMLRRLLGWSFTTTEDEALAKVIGAIKREAPKTEHSSLVRTIRLISAAVT